MRNFHFRLFYTVIYDEQYMKTNEIYIIYRKMEQKRASATRLLEINTKIFKCNLDVKFLNN